MEEPSSITQHTMYHNKVYSIRYISNHNYAANSQVVTGQYVWHIFYTSLSEIQYAPQ